MKEGRFLVFQLIPGGDSLSRHARQMSSTNIYHVMMRGINRQDIFEDNEDYKCFLDVLRECKKISEFELYAYCIMSNHIHLMIKTGKEPLDLIFKRIGSRFVYWYNLKYQRVGHLFQDRYRSEPVENEAYFVRTLRYIIQNPITAGLENVIGNYPWSSYKCYLGKNDKLTDTYFAIQIFKKREELVNYLNQKNEDSALEFPSMQKRVTDEQAKILIRKITCCNSVAEYQALDKSMQKEYVKKLRHNNLSFGQIARMTGLSKTTVYRFAK